MSYLFSDQGRDRDTNTVVAEFVRSKIRGIVKDPATADLLCPDNVFGCKRLCVDTGYFDTYNKPHVKLVDVAKTPIERFTDEGVVVAGTLYPLDAVVCATGFAAMPGPLRFESLPGNVRPRPTSTPSSTYWSIGGSHVSCKPSSPYWPPSIAW